MRISDIPRNIPRLIKKSAKLGAVIIVPTRELADQVQQQLQSLTIYCSKEIPTVNLAADGQDSCSLQQAPGNQIIVVATPSKLVRAFEQGWFTSLTIDSALSLVIDEADLIFSFGYEEEVHKMFGYLPKTFQYYLMSATLSSVRALNPMDGGSNPWIRRWKL